MPSFKVADNDIANYITLNGLLHHPLVAKGYVSIGDWHSTKPLEEGMSAEDTRFNGERRECGLHVESSEGDYMI